MLYAALFLFISEGCQVRSAESRRYDRGYVGPGKIHQ